MNAFQTAITISMRPIKRQYKTADKTTPEINIKKQRIDTSYNALTLQLGRYAWRTLSTYLTKMK